jgi:hypothetical protein
MGSRISVGNRNNRFVGILLGNLNTPHIPAFGIQVLNEPNPVFVPVYKNMAIQQRRFGVAFGDLIDHVVIGVVTLGREFEVKISPDCGQKYSEEEKGPKYPRHTSPSAQHRNDFVAARHAS